MSAHPMTPNPILRLPLFIFSIWGMTYLFMSIVLSKKRVTVRTVSRKRGQSTSPSFVMYLAKLMLPKLHESYGPKGCSPHGLVASIS